MAVPAESGVSITFADLDIDVSRCRHGEQCKVRCPRCAGSHSPGKQRATDLSVNIQTGAFSCHRCGWVSGLRGEAVRRDPNWTKRQHSVIPSRSLPKPDIRTATPVAISKLPQGKPDWLYAWFADRGISQATVDDFAITGTTGKMQGGTEDVRKISLPYFVGGELVNIKFRYEPGKVFKQLPEPQKCLFNVDRAEGQRTIVHAEGELDVLACHEAGWVAVSLPDGAPGTYPDPDTGELRVAQIGSKINGLYEKKSHQVTQAASRIILAVDGDQEGDELRKALIEHYGAVRCWQVTWPEGCKDANDVLVKYGADKLDDVIASARPVDLPGIKTFGSALPELLRRYHHGIDKGVSTGWPEFDDFYTVRKGTLNVISGIPGNGKTSWVLAMFANVAYAQGWKCGIFSPEAGDDATLYSKLVQLTADRPFAPGTDGRMSEEELLEAAAWVDRHFVRVDASRHDEENYQMITVPEIISRWENLILRDGLDMAVIDPWNRLEAAKRQGQDMLDYIPWALNALSRFAERHQVATFVVVHPTKLRTVQGEDEPIPEPYDIMGSSHWYNMADVILGIGRKKRGDPRNETTVEVQKVREEDVYGNLGQMQFYYDGRSRRFHVDQHGIPMTPGSRPFYLPAVAPGVAAD
jgi:twinkle protein